MKTFLYGTTAMIAAAAVAGTASAQQAAKKPNEKITLQLGGYYEADYIFGDESKGQKACPIRNAATGVTAGCADPIAGGPNVPFGGLVNEPGRGRRFQGIVNEGEIYFRGQTTLDNGLTIGAFAQLELMTTGDQIDEQYIYFSGSFGRVEYGSMDGVAFQMGYGAPAAIQGRSTYIYNKRDYRPGGVGIGGGGLATVQTAAAITGGGPDADKINYYTPRIAGFQFGISYTPDNCEPANPGNVGLVGGGGAITNGLTAGVAQVGTVACGGNYGGFSPTNTNGQQGDIVDLSVNFVRTVFGVNVATNFFWVKGNLEGPTGAGTVNGILQTNQKELGFGVNLSYMGFTLGGGWRRDNVGVRSNNTDRTDYAVGLRYRTGPWQFGVDYGKVEQGQGIAGAGVQVAAGSRAGTDSIERVAAGVDYTMGPGIRFYGGAQYFNIDDNFRNPANENNGVIFVLGTRLDF